MNAAERLISGARRGRFNELLPDLLDMAGRPGGDRDEAWEATAAAIQVLFWQDRFAEAADLAEALIAQDGPLGGELCDQDMPFRTALLAGELHAGTPARPRLLAGAARVPEGRNLGDDLLWLAEELPERPVEELLPSPFDWGGPAEPLDEVAVQLAERDFSTLDADDRYTLWEALAKANDFDRAHRLVESSGRTPDRHSPCLWMAGWYAVRGDVPRGERMLLAAHDRWWPYMRWDAIPDAPVLQPTLRLVVTDRVREHYLTRPIGPEAEKTA
ncbi:hypothetical protein [Kitasatospora terrestris]|uniref:Tetratricopeptide repeat protein n=1 Tax=Kitasatospora terrestris TaxID=258051 RepID=A0ABP9EGD7_9ACTN